MNNLLAFATLLLSFSAQAQLRVSPLAPAAVPAALRRSGRVVQALRYTDHTGTYTVLATEIGPRPDPAAQNSDGQRADLYAYQYPATGPSPSWQVHDFVDDCPLDLEAGFLPKALSVTDLDQDGTAEVWLVYRTTCRGDVSPSTQKVIMYEGPRKYAVRGTSRIALGGGQHDGGTYNLDAAWAAAPTTFRQHAAQLWQQHRDERLSE
ncbi:M949_RS01915 family surface polysaccharide biosynthesis protein [Hymenobacter bucti]|uniref:M949_RS01915 family surface polysaccharide biosynthesis protein n=1 Tax=Hymenobacter bucti TaxID=1844114 RepID=A0ABW4QZU9_9BACT